MRARPSSPPSQGRTVSVRMAGRDTPEEEEVAVTPVILVVTGARTEVMEMTAGVTVALAGRGQAWTWTSQPSH